MKNRILFYWLLTFNTICLIKCDNNVPSEIHNNIRHQTDDIYTSIIQIKRDLHKNPELAGNEIRTSKLVAKYLLELGLEVTTNVGGHGVVGVLKGTKSGNGKAIAWRADMDALPHPLNESDVFKSVIKNVSHGCGHDAHVAIGLGIATVLSKNRESFSGKVYFIFQAEEETFLGANKMMKSEFFLNHHIDEIYTSHITALPVNTIAVKPKEVFAYQTRIKLSLSKEIPLNTIDSVYSLIQIKLNDVKENTNPYSIENAFKQPVGILNEKSHFHQYSFLQDGYVREINQDDIVIKAFYYSTKNSKNITSRVENILSKSRFNSYFNSISIIQNNPTVLNDDNLVNSAIETLNDIYENNPIEVSNGQIPYFNDDFIYFQQQIPGVYFLLGASNEESKIIALNHSPDFKVDESSIKTGVQEFSSLIFERAK